MKMFEYTNKGGRELNQDYLTYAEISKDASVYVVADGMGGYEGGEVAARLVGDTVVDFVCAHYSELSPEQLLGQAFVFANSSLMVKRMAMGVAEMGSVVVVALVIERTAHIAWLGDSRAYLLRGGNIEYMTVDHSLINELKAAGTYKESDKEQYESCVTRCIMGDNASNEAGYNAVEVESGDVLILCSDGLHKELDVEFLPSDDDALKAQLDALAPSMGDNCSLIRIKY